MPAGRPRAFDTEKALDSALRVFWQKGYEGATLPELTKAMGINRPSMYAAFGNKESLFRKSLDRYCAGLSAVGVTLSEPDIKTAISKFLICVADKQTDPLRPRGCLMVQGALSCSDNADPIRRELIARRAGIEGALRGRLEQAKTDGQLSATTNPADTARYIAIIVHGMAVQSSAGASRDELHRVAETALRAIWP